MTTFTDDLENDLEVLAEHHEVTPVQVAKTAIALLPEDYRHALIRSLGAAQQQLDKNPKEGHTLPLALRATIHGLVQRFPANLVVDAAMLEMPEEVRQEVARAFLRQSASDVPLKRRGELVERETGKVLISSPCSKDYYGPGYLRVAEADGSSTLYQIDRDGPEHGIEHELTLDGSVIVRTFYRKVTAE